MRLSKQLRAVAQHRRARQGRTPLLIRPPTQQALVSSAPTKPPMSGALHPSRLLWVVPATGVVLLLAGSSAHADTVVVALAGSVTDVLNNVRNWIMGILAGLATVFLSVGGVRYLIGGGEPSEIEKAKTAFKSAGWGYGLAALAPLVVEILKGIVGA